MPSSCSQYHVVSWPLSAQNPGFWTKANMLSYTPFIHSCNYTLIQDIISVLYKCGNSIWMRMSLSNVNVYGILTVLCKSAIKLICYNYCFRNCYRREKGTLKNAMNKCKCFIMEDKTLLDMQQLMQTHHHNVFSSAGVTTTQ